MSPVDISLRSTRQQELAAPAAGAARGGVNGGQDGRGERPAVEVNVRDRFVSMAFNQVDATEVLGRHRSDESQPDATPARTSPGGVAV
jgi:hypothetical protein